MHRSSRTMTGMKPGFQFVVRPWLSNLTRSGRDLIARSGTSPPALTAPSDIGTESVIHEPPHLTEFDEEEQDREVYAWAGLALYWAQVFEQGLIHALYACQVVDGTLAQNFSSADDF